MASARRITRLVVFVVLGIVGSVQQASASHLAYGTMSWKRLPDPLQPGLIRVQLRIEIGYRRSYIENLPGGAGLGIDAVVPQTEWVLLQNQHGGFLENVGLPLRIAAISVSEDLVIVAATIERMYPATDYPLQVTLSTGDRLTALREGNRDRPFLLTMLVDPSAGDRLPAVSLPRIYLPQSVPASLMIPAPALYESFARAEFAPAAASGLLTPIPVGHPTCTDSGCAPGTPGAMQLDSSGVMSWEPAAAGLYATQFRIASYDMTLNSKGALPLDLTIDVVPFACDPTKGPCHARPEFGPQPVPLFVKHDQPVSIPIEASSIATLPGLTVALSPLMLPGGATFAQTNEPAGTNATGEMTWTPTVADLGLHFACFRAIDSTGLVNFGLHCAEIDVYRDFVVTFHSGGGTAVPTQFVTPNTTATEPPPPTLDAYFFEGWTLDPTPDPFSNLFVFTTTLPRDIDLYAVWIPGVTVSYYDGGVLDSTAFIKKGTLASPPSLVKDGYTLSWYSDEALTQPFDLASPVNSDISLHAKWTPIPYTFGGFFAPVDNLPTLNVGQAGRAFPLKWRLARADGTTVTDLTSFVSVTESVIPCDAAQDAVLEEQLAASTVGGIRYDAAADLFIYTWRTQKGQTGCRLLTVVLDDGTSHAAKFKLK